MKIYRKRYIPNEIVDISGDEVIYIDEEKLITSWTPIKPRGDIGKGMSCVYFNEGWKISKFYNLDGSFKFWYCDIIDYEYDKSEDTYIIKDLLVDVIVHEDGTYEILDEEELDQALQEGLITEEIKAEAIFKLNKLLEKIKSQKFHELDF